MLETLNWVWLHFKEEISTIMVVYKFSLIRIIYLEIIVKFSTALLLFEESDCYTPLFNPSVMQGDLNEINGAKGRIFKFLEVNLHLFLLIPIKQPNIVRFVLNFHQNGDKGTL